MKGVRLSRKAPQPCCTTETPLTIRNAKRPISFETYIQLPACSSISSSFRGKQRLYYRLAPHGEEEVRRQRIPRTRGQLLSGARTAKQCEKTKNKEEEEEEEVKKRWICKGQYAMRTD